MHSWLYGYFGRANIGDEAILSAVLASLPPDATSRVLSLRPGHTARVHRHSAMLAPSLEGTSARGWWKRWRYALRWSAPLLRDTLRQPVCVYACGGAVNDHVVGRVEMLLERVRRLRRLGCAAVAMPALGAEFLTEPGDRKAALQLFDSEVAYASVRDELSRDALLDVGVDPARVHLAADLVYLLEPRQPPSSPPAGPLRVALNLRPLFNAPHERGLQGARHRDAYHTAAVALVEGLNRRFGIVDLLPFGPADASLLAAIAARAGGRVQPCADDPLAMLDQVGQYDVVVGMRYHACVFAFLAGAACLPLPYASKVMELAWALDLPAERLSVSDGAVMPANQLDVPAVLEQVDQLIERLGEHRRRQRELTEQGRSAAREDIEQCWRALREAREHPGRARVSHQMERV